MAKGSSVFGARNLVATGSAVPAAGADNHVNIKGSAGNWPSITGKQFLKGPEPGQDQALIKSGDQTVDIEKKLRTHIKDEEIRLVDTVGRTTKITKSEELSVTEDIKESAKMKINIAAGVELTLQGPAGMIKIDATGVTIQGVLVKIN